MRPRLFALGLALELAVFGCASSRALAASSPYRLTAKPAVHEQSVPWQLVDATVFSPVTRLLRRPRPSVDLADGGVPDTSFFTNRDIASLSPAAIQAGPTEPGHRAQPPFTVTRLKDEGKTAGLFVKDAKGDRYLFKFDFIGRPDLITGAEVVSSKLLHALGYYVPSYEIEQARVSDFRIEDGQGIEAEDVRRVLAPRVRGGTVRMSASRLVDGEILGSFRSKDYRDLAELRALRLAYAWINNTDAKDHNTLMVWTGDRAIGYLIDFGSSLGGDAERGAKRPCQGWTNDVDLQVWTAELLTFGLYDSGCKLSDRPYSTGVGLLSSRFDPRRWKPYAPNFAFEEMTREDARWMAGRLARFTREQLAAAVAAGRYGRREDAQYLIEVLDARRQQIVEVYRP